MNKLTRFISIMLFMLLFLFSTKANSQNPDFTKLTQNLPPSPNAASLGKYGGIDVGLSTGSVNTRIALFDYESISLKLPISLGYFSNGFKVDEVSSRVGTGWSFNAGGVITRTVMGNPDEQTQYYPPVQNNMFPITVEMITYLNNMTAASSGESNYDAQPDQFNFNFNGYTGRFYLDQNRNPILLSHTALKIERYDVNGMGFKIITPDGIQYFFGGHSATEFSRSTLQGPGCNGVSKYDANFKATSWYLYQIKHPNNDVINFSYSPLEFSYPAGRSENIYKREGISGNVIMIGNEPYDGAAGPSFPPPPVDTYCINYITVQSVLLNEISSSLGNKINFDYITRNDCNDKLLSKIRITGSGQVNPYKVFDLSYTNSFKGRPFLSAVSEKSDGGGIEKKHSFEYNGFYLSPEYLSYSQDHWGYYNGKGNTTLIPRPKASDLQVLYPEATADRTEDPEFCKQGLLSSITYPTGGQENIFYEGNTVYKQVTTLPAKVQVAASQYNTGFTIGSSFSGLIPISYNQFVQVFANCNINDEASTVFPSGSAYIQIIDQSNGSVIFSHDLQIGDRYSQQFVIPQGNYKIKVEVAGQNMMAEGYFSYLPNQGVVEYKNVNSGGVRVAKINSISGNGEVMVKKYLYAKLGSPNISSGVGVTSDELTYHRANLVYGSYPPLQSRPECRVICAVNCSTNSSSTWALIFASGGAPTIYTDVVESFGESFENGGIEHQYTAVPDQFGTILAGQQMPGPFTSFNYKNGLEVYQGHFKKVANNYVPVKKIFTHFKEDARADQEFKSYIVNKRYDVCRDFTTPTAMEVSAFDLYSYSTFKKWVYPDTVKTRIYDINGMTYNEELQVNEYGNVNFPLLTKETNISSDNSLQVKIHKYPFDFQSTPPYNLMVSNYIISPLIEDVKQKDNTFIESIKTNYRNWNNTIFAPDSISTKFSTEAADTRLKYWNFDNRGNILSVSKKQGAKNCFIWGYGGKLMVAQISNIEYQMLESILGANAITTFREILSPSDQQVKSFLQPLRDYAQTNPVYVESFTYDLIKGVTSRTDIKGLTSYYEYDAFQRLLAVKDQNGHISKSYDYHFKP